MLNLIINIILSVSILFIIYSFIVDPLLNIGYMIIIAIVGGFFFVLLAGNDVLPQTFGTYVVICIVVLFIDSCYSLTGGGMRGALKHS